MFSAFNPSKWSSSGSSRGFGALLKGLSCGHFQPEPGFEPTTSGYKSNAQSYDCPEHLKEPQYLNDSRLL